MEDIKIEGNVVQKIVEESLPKIIQDSLGSGYGSPIKKVVDDEIQKQEGSIRAFVRETIASALADEKFKDKIASELIAMMIQKGMSR